MHSFKSLVLFFLVWAEVEGRLQRQSLDDHTVFELPKLDLNTRGNERSLFGERFGGWFRSLKTFFASIFTSDSADGADFEEDGEDTLTDTKAESETAGGELSAYIGYGPASSLNLNEVTGLQCNSTEDVRLCSTDDEWLLTTSEQAQFSFSPCCSFKDSLPSECSVKKPGGGHCRYKYMQPLETCNSFFSIHLGFDRHEQSSCCKSCTCFGDPNCIDFNGNMDTWILCDARTPQHHKDGRVDTSKRCIIRKETCEAQIDHEGNSCKWVGPELAGSKQDEAEKSYSVSEHGSPCISDPAGNASKILMYAADSFSAQITQSERGIISHLEISTSSGLFSLDPEQCIYQEGFGWDHEGVDSTVASTLFKKHVLPTGEVLYQYLDSETNIFLQVRCTFNVLGNGDRSLFRLNIEDISEPFEDLSLRSNVNGFCSSGEMGKSGSYIYTDYLDSNGYCDPSTLDEGSQMYRNQMKLRSARVICENPGIEQQGIEQCLRDFCARFFLPGFDSVDKCVEDLNEDFTAQSFSAGVCKAIASSQSNICEALILENSEPDYIAGLNQAVQRYMDVYVAGVAESVAGCIGSSNWRNILPTTLSQCQQGLQIQVESSSGVWDNLVGIPEEVALCEGRIDLGCGDFDISGKALRISQCEPLSSCGQPACATTSGLIGYVEKTPLGADQTLQPTYSPTFAPTFSPSFSPVVWVREPTFSPTLSPIAEPTTAPLVTSTSKPSEFPTLSPVSTPQPTISGRCPYNHLASVLDFNFTASDILLEEGEENSVVIRRVGEVSWLGGNDADDLDAELKLSMNDTDSSFGPNNVKFVGDALAIQLPCTGEGISLSIELLLEDGTNLSPPQMDITFFKVANLEVTSCDASSVFVGQNGDLRESDDGYCVTVYDTESSDDLGYEYEYIASREIFATLTSPKDSSYQEKNSIAFRYKGKSSVIFDVVTGSETDGCREGEPYILLGGTSDVADCFELPGPGL